MTTVSPLPHNQSPQKRPKRRHRLLDHGYIFFTNVLSFYFTNRYYLDSDNGMIIELRGLSKQQDGRTAGTGKGEGGDDIDNAGTSNDNSCQHQHQHHTERATTKMDSNNICFFLLLCFTNLTICFYFI